MYSETSVTLIASNCRPVRVEAWPCFCFRFFMFFIFFLFYMNISVAKVANNVNRKRKCHFGATYMDSMTGGKTGDPFLF